MESISLKEQFKMLPTINPKTGEEVQIGSKEYYVLVHKYGKPNKIKSPESHKMISVGKIAYNKLIKQGYTDKNLLLNEPLNNNIKSKNGKGWAD